MRRTIVIILTIIIAGCLTATGSVAWVMARDGSALNNLFLQTNDTPPEGRVNAREDFDGWEKKQVWAENNSAYDAIVRMRLEEFLNIHGSMEGQRIESARDIFKANDLMESSDVLFPGKHASSGIGFKDNIQAVWIHFPVHAYTESEWINMGRPLTQNGSPLWICMDDGWFYYTDYLTKGTDYNESTGEYTGGGISRDLIEKLEKADDITLWNKFGRNVEINYFINVRLEAMSADLSDYGSTDDPKQWTNLVNNYEGGKDMGQGNAILAIPGKPNNYEVRTNTAVTEGSSADILIKMVHEKWLEDGRE